MSTCLSQVALLVVTSAVLAAAGYCESSQSLVLVFRSGSAYGYFGVPSDIFRALLIAESKGTYFNRSIRGVFPHAAIALPGRMHASPAVCPRCPAQHLGGSADGRV